MIIRNDNVIEDLFRIRKEESTRVRNQYGSAMELRQKCELDAKKLIRTILPDLPEDGEIIPNNQD